MKDNQYSFNKTDVSDIVLNEGTSVADFRSPWLLQMSITYETCQSRWPKFFKLSFLKSFLKKTMQGLYTQKHTNAFGRGLKIVDKAIDLGVDTFSWMWTLDLVA